MKLKQKKSQSQNSKNCELDILRAALEHASQSVWVFELPTYKLEYTNKEATEKLLGHPVFNFYEDPNLLYSLIPEEDRVFLNDAVEECLKNGSAEAEHRLIQKDGTFIWVRANLKVLKDETGTPLRLVQTLINTTAERKAKEERLVSTEKLSMILSTFALGVWELDIQDKTLTFDDTMCNLFDIHDEEPFNLLNISQKTIHEEDRQLVNTAFENLLKSSNSFLALEFRIVLSNGQIRYIHSKITVHRTQEGVPVKCTGVNQDISIKKILDHEREKTDHEINNALAIILGKANVLKGHLTNTPLNKDSFLKEIEKIIEMSNRVVKSLKAKQTLNHNTENKEAA